MTQFVRDYNRGDSKALAALFTEDAEAIEAEGDRYQGRDLIERRFAETFAASPGVKIAIEVASIRFLSPDVAKEEGQTVITPRQGGPPGPPVHACSSSSATADGSSRASARKPTPWSARTIGSGTSNG